MRLLRHKHSCERQAAMYLAEELTRSCGSLHCTMYHTCCAMRSRSAMSILRGQIQSPHLQACMMCSGTEDEDCMCPWIESLPEEVHLPLFQYSVADLEACQDPEVIREAKCIRESAQSVYRVLTTFALALPSWCDSLFHLFATRQGGDSHWPNLYLCQ